MDSLDLFGQLGVGDGPGRGDASSALVVGGTGDLEQATALVDAVTCSLLRLDEGVELIGWVVATGVSMDGNREVLGG